MIEHPDIGNILPLDGKDTAGKPIRGFKISLSRSGWLIYDEPAAREMHKMLAEMIAKWDAPNAPREGRAAARTLDADVRQEVTHG